MVPSSSTGAVEDGGAASVVDIGDAASTRVAVEAATRALPPRRRAVAVLCVIEGWTPTEAAGALRLSASTARVQLHEARQQLQAALGPVDNL